MDFENDMRIDETALDVEWLDQPELMFKYAKQAAESKLQLDHVKEKLDVVKAKLDKAIRTDPATFGVEKITETVVQNTIIMQETYQRVATELANQKYEYEITLAATKAVDQRKTALENLVKLHGMSYFAGPSAPRDLTAEKTRRANKKVKMKRNNNKTKGEKNGKEE